MVAELRVRLCQALRAHAAMSAICWSENRQAELGSQAAGRCSVPVARPATRMSRAMLEEP